MTIEYVPVSSIQTEGRQRKYFDLAKLIELADDIKQNGLLHAPILQHDSLILLAGERRLRAIEMLHDTEVSFMYAGQPVPPGHIPVTRAHPRDSLGWQEAELAENLSRMDLTWQERCAAIAQLQRLRQAQNPGWRMKDTLEELRERGATPDQNRVSEELRVAEHLEDPEVASAKTRKDAVRVIEKKAREKKANELAARFDLSAKGASPHTPIHSDCRAYLESLPEGGFDVILTDPPYGIEAQDHGSQNILGHQYDDSYSSWRDLMLWLAKESMRQAKPQAHLYMFCSIERFFEAKGLFTAEGWDVWPRPLIWSKGNGMLPKPDYGPRYTYEAILFATKGQKKIMLTGAPDVLTVPMVFYGRIHGAEKPVALYVELLRRSCLPGATILDPFMGTGTIFPAANVAKCVATGIEVNSTHFGVAISRLGGVT